MLFSILLQNCIHSNHFLLHHNFPRIPAHISMTPILISIFLAFPISLFTFFLHICFFRWLHSMFDPSLVSTVPGSVFEFIERELAEKMEVKRNVALTFVINIHCNREATQNCSTSLFWLANMGSYTLKSHMDKNSLRNNEARE